jgi:hypothetical protein
MIIPYISTSLQAKTVLPSVVRAGRLEMSARTTLELLLEAQASLLCSKDNLNEITSQRRINDG